MYTVDVRLLQGGSLKVPWLSIVKSLPVWAVTIAHFANNWGYYTLLMCLPQYLKNILHFDMKSVSLILADLGAEFGGHTPPFPLPFPLLLCPSLSLLVILFHPSFPFPSPPLLFPYPPSFYFYLPQSI